MDMSDDDEDELLAVDSEPDDDDEAGDDDDDEGGEDESAEEMTPEALLALISGRAEAARAAAAPPEVAELRELIASAVLPPLTLTRLQTRAAELHAVAARLEAAERAYRAEPGRSPYVNERDGALVGALAREAIAQHGDALLANAAVPLLLHGRGSAASVAAARLMLACASCAASDRQREHCLALLRDEVALPNELLMSYL